MEPGTEPEPATGTVGTVLQGTEIGTGAIATGPVRTVFREWPRYCRKVYWTKMVQNSPNDDFGQMTLFQTKIFAFARPKWTKMVHFGQFWPEEVHFGPFRSANRTLAIPEFCRNRKLEPFHARTEAEPKRSRATLHSAICHRCILSGCRNLSAPLNMPCRTPFLPSHIKK